MSVVRQIVYLLRNDAFIMAVTPGERRKFASYGIVDINCP